MIYMLDTNICIYIIKRKPIQVLKKLMELPVSSVCISTITLSELECGAQKSSVPEQNKLALTEFLASIKIIPFCDNSAQEYGFIRACLEQRGTPIGPLDTLIAAHARALRYTLITNNTKEFARVPGLLIENWVQ